jgi:hypothetical protein
VSRIQLGELPVDQLPGDLMAVPFFADQAPPEGRAALIDWRLNGGLTQLLACGRATGALGEQILLPGNGKLPAHWILFQGAGYWHRIDSRALAETLAISCLRAGFSRFSLALPSVLAGDAAVLVAAVEHARQLTGSVDMNCAIGFWPMAG